MDIFAHLADKLEQTDKEQDIFEWLRREALVNEKGFPLEFEDHAFLRGIISDLNPRQVVKKAAQIGFTTTAMIKTAYLAATRGMNIIYTLPTREMVYEAIPTKMDALLANNRALRSWMGESSTQKKQFGKGWIFYKGTFGDREAIMTQSDLNCHDELDRSDMGVIESLESRMSASKYGWTWYFSNPSVPNVGVDRYWDKSDQKMWYVKCKCGYEQPLIWPDNVDYERKVYVCSKCKREISDYQRQTGEWRPTADGDISGYWINQMMAPWISAKRLIAVEDERTKEYFYNFVLGLPYIGTEHTISRDLLLRNCTVDEFDESDPVMGIDQNPVAGHHYVIGNDQGIFRYGVCEDWEDIAALIERFNCRTVVMDAQPERTLASELAQRFKGRVWLAFYQSDKYKPKDLKWVEWELGQSICHISRTQAIDATIEAFEAGKIRFPSDYAHDRRFQAKTKKSYSYCDHWDAMYMRTEQDKHGEPLRVWEHSGSDHFVHATVYYWTALQRGWRGDKRKVIYLPERKRKKMQPWQLMDMEMPKQRLRDL